MIAIMEKVDELKRKVLKDNDFILEHWDLLSEDTKNLLESIGIKKLSSDAS